MRALFPLLLYAAASAHSATVAIDVGHFIEEPGATSARGRPELDFNRELALEIEAAAQGRSLKTTLIGYDGFMSHLTQRTAAAAHADFFLSIHHDSVQPYLIEAWEYDRVERSFSDLHSGFSLFISRKNRSLSRSLACASAIGEALRGAGFKTARTPAVLLEAGVIVNRDEELKVRSEETRKRIAAAVALGLDRCLGRGGVRAAPAQ